MDGKGGLMGKPGRVGLPGPNGMPGPIGMKVGSVGVRKNSFNGDIWYICINK